jgi:hypothetical protein
MHVHIFKLVGRKWCEKYIHLPSPDPVTNKMFTEYNDGINIGLLCSNLLGFKYRFSEPEFVHLLGSPEIDSSLVGRYDNPI